MKTNDELLAEIDRLRADNARMAAWFEPDCQCPCCLELRNCLKDCTFAADAPDGAERMKLAREALYGETP